jgi:hypothetical protein
MNVTETFEFDGSAYLPCSDRIFFFAENLKWL